MDQIRHVIKTTIPEVTGEEVEKLEQRLILLGVRTCHDLRYIIESDISGCLKPVQTRILLDQIRRRKCSLSSNVDRYYEY